MAERGYSRDHRPDCKQVCIALVVTREGVPLAYEVFRGNTTDVTTVETIVELVEGKYGKAGRIWVMDRGMVSEQNLAFLRKRQSQYVVGTPKSMLWQFETELKQRDWTEVQPGIQVRLAARTECGETLLERNSRAAAGFDLRVVSAPHTAAGITLQGSRRLSWWRWSRLSSGAYVLRSNVAELAPAAFWKTYVQLTDAENAFRLQKSDLRLRPIWHQKTERVEAHILVCFLAYVLYKTLEQWEQRAGLGKSPQKILAEFSRIYTADVILPIVDGPEVRIRCVVRPDAAQSILIQRLGLELPQRLRIPSKLKM